MGLSMISGGRLTDHREFTAVSAILIRNVSLFHVLRIGPRTHRFWRPGDPASNFFRSDVP